MNCYECKFKGSVPGSAHSTCHHDVAETYKPLAMMKFAVGVGTTNPFPEYQLDNKPIIEFDAHGVRSGWCSWPFDFDPTWVKHCGLFESKLKNTSISEEKFLNLLSMLENEFSFEDRVKCLRFIFDKMIEQRQAQIKECEETVQNLAREVAAIRHEFEIMYEPTEQQYE